MREQAAVDWWGFLLLVGVIGVGLSLTLMFFVLRHERLRSVDLPVARRIALILTSAGLLCTLVSGTVHFVDNHGLGSVEAYGISGFVRSHPSFVVLLLLGLLGIWASRVKPSRAVGISDEESGEDSTPI